MLRADGGYGGTDTNYRYSFELPDGWKTDTVSKVEKATNGTDARYVDPGNKSSKAYVTSFMGCASFCELRRCRCAGAERASRVASGIPC